MTVAKAILDRFTVVWARVERDERGSEFVQFAIVVLIVGVMGTGLYAAVENFWPDAVDSVIRRIADLLLG